MTENKEKEVETGETKENLNLEDLKGKISIGDEKKSPELFEFITTPKPQKVEGKMFDSKTKEEGKDGMKFVDFKIPDEFQKDERIIKKKRLSLDKGVDGEVKLTLLKDQKKPDSCKIEFSEEDKKKDDEMRDKMIQNTDRTEKEKKMRCKKKKKRKIFEKKMEQIAKWTE